MRRVVLAGAVIICCVAATPAAALETQTFTFTGGTQTFSVPAGVTSITYQVVGGAGGNSALSLGGAGAFVQGTTTVTPGEAFSIVVGGKGADSKSGGAGGFNGGGAGGGGGHAGGGGGRTEFRSADNVIRVIAGGGGGAGGSALLHTCIPLCNTFTDEPGGAGAAGGTGDPGMNGSTNTGLEGTAHGGEGASGTGAGGDGGDGEHDGADGTSGVFDVNERSVGGAGGTGGTTTNQGLTSSGGGGGGGGGGAAFSGGGGGGGAVTHVMCSDGDCVAATSGGGGGGSAGTTLAPEGDTVGPSTAHGSTTARVVVTYESPIDTSINSGPAAGSTSTATTATFTYSGTPAPSVGHFDCSLDNAAFATCASSGVTYTGLGDGSHTFKVRAVDTGGTVDGTPATRNWTVDTTAPDTSISSGPSATASTNGKTASFTYAGSPATDTAGFECSLDQASFATCPATGESYSDLTDGPHTFAVRAVDAVGNADASPATRTWTIDTAAPVVSCASADGKQHAANVNIPCTASDAGSGLANPAQANFALTTNVQAGTQTDDAFTNSIAVCDNAGNCATAGPVGGNHVDLLAPTVTFATPANGGTYSLLGALLGQVRASYSCSDGASRPVACTGTSANGSSVPLGLGSQTFTVTATDAAGNRTTVTHTYTMNLL